MDIGLEILSEIITFSKYAKFKKELSRRETWDEIVDRYLEMMIKKYPSLEKDIKWYGQHIRHKKVLPSMRSLQFAGKAAEVSPNRIYNCAYLPIDSIYSFNETMFLLLGGSGVGFSVQKHHVAKLPAIIKPTRERRYLIADSIEGWADAVKMLFKGYTSTGTRPLFDFRNIREKGTPLVTAGGKAPGPEPLKECLFQIQKILDRKAEGEQLTTVECYDIECYIANAVLAGGIRRAALIALFSHDDESMITSKYGNWWELNEQRGRCNNSAVLKRGEISEAEFKNLWARIEASGSGEPGIYWTNDLDWGTNPCCEVALRPFQFCNLCEINADDVEDQEDLNQRVRVAAFFGTLQAGFTDFHYLRPIWKRTTEKDALLGLGLTGIASGKILGLDLQVAARLAQSMNHVIADEIGVNHSSRITLVKPAGTTSGVLRCSSGIHAWHNDYYLRTIRFNKNEDIASYLIVNHPELVEDDILRPQDTICVRIPIKAPEGSILRTETALNTLERVKKFAVEWVKPGHISGENTHNVSATISIDKNKKHALPRKSWDQVDKYWVDEWIAVGNWMWENKDFYNGLSVLPFSDHSYLQAPFEDITEEQYLERVSHIQNIDLTKVMEVDNNVRFEQTEACAGGKCEI